LEYYVTGNRAEVIICFINYGPTCWCLVHFILCGWLSVIQWCYPWL